MIFQCVDTGHQHQNCLQGWLKIPTPQPHLRTGETGVSKGGTQKYVLQQAPPLKTDSHRLKVIHFE